MKKYILSCFILLLATQAILAQVSGVRAIPGDYATLTEAFQHLRTVGISGPVYLELQNNYSSSGEVFPIKIREIPGSGANAVTVSPAPGVTDLLIFSSTSSSLIDFIGAYNVVFDGRPGRTGSEVELSISSHSSSGRVIGFLDGSVGNVVTYCNVEGYASAILSGNNTNLVFFGRSSDPIPNGILFENANNTLSNCSVVGYVSPHSLIYALGSSSVDNAGNNIVNNEIRNFHESAIDISGNSGSNWNISGNSIYNLNNSSTFQRGISFNPGENSVNNIISGNYIGGKAGQAGGTQMITPGIFAIYLATGDVTVENNVIKNIWVENGFENNAQFIGIIVYGNATARIRGNFIGSESEEDGIMISGDINSFIGIRTIPCFSISIENNRMSSITMQSTNGQQDFTGIMYREGSSTIVTGNQVDNITASSMGSVAFKAITSFTETFDDCPAPPQPPVFDQNLVFNITLSSGEEDADFIGVEIKGAGIEPVKIHNNQVYRINVSSPGGVASVTGIKINDRVSGNTGNIVGSATEANSIMVTGQSASANGIVLNNSPQVSVSDDIIANITAVATITPAAVNGIVVGNGAITNISGNQVHHLTASITNGILIQPTNGSSVVTLENNILTGLSNNTGNGIETFVASEASLHLIATENTISNWQTGVNLAAQAGASLQQSFQNNSLVSNQAAFTNASGTPVNATCNWWGHASGPSGAGPGSGNPVGPNVIFSPWATTADYVAVNAGPDQTIYAGYGPSNKTLTPTYTACGTVSYLWSTGATTASITVSPSTTTVYSVTVTDAGGHQATDQVTVVVKDFRCGTKNSKILVCQKGPNGKKTTLCVTPLVAVIHLLFGAELGTCSPPDASAKAMESINKESLKGEENIEPVGLTLYPNPADNQIQLRWNAVTAAQVTVNILDMHGRTVFTQKIVQAKGINYQQILLPKLASGNYIVVMQTGEGINRTRFIVRHP